MASEQLQRRENTSVEREVHVEKDRVTKMTTHFEHLAEEVKESDDSSKDTPQGTQFESLADKVKGGGEHGGRKSENVAASDAQAQHHNVGKFESGEEFEGRTREVTGSVPERSGENKESVGQVTAEEARGGDRGREEGVSEGQRLQEAIGGGAETEAAKAKRNQEQEIFQGGRVGGGAAETEGAKAERNQEPEEAQTKNESETLRSKEQTAPQQGYVDATKETLSGGAKAAAEYTAPVAEKAKDYTLQAAEKAKDVTVESGKTAAEYAGKTAVDLKDKAAVAAWKAANFGTEVTVEGTKTAVHVVEGAAGYAGQKAAELAVKSVGAVKGLAASAGETAKEYTARKKDEAQRDLDLKKASQFQEGRTTQGVGETVSLEGTGSSVLSSIGETVGNVGQQIKKPFQNITGSGQTEESNRIQQGQQQIQHEGGEAMTRVGDVAQRVKKPLDTITGNITEGGGEVLGAVGETVGEIGESMIKPAETAQEQHQGKEGQQGGGVLGAVGETISEIAHTTKLMVGGEEESETMHKNVEGRRKNP